MKQFFALLLTLGTVLLSGCGRETPAAVSFTAAGGTGYAWEAAVADETVAACTLETAPADGNLPGGPVSYTFTFTGLAAGETAVTFTYGRSWEDTCLRRSCTAAVDEKGHATLGPLSDAALVIDLGSGDYSALCLDSDVLAVSLNDQSGLCTCTPGVPGETRLDFFYTGQEEDLHDRSLTVTVGEDGSVTWLEAQADEAGALDMGFTPYKTAKELSEAAGCFVPACREMKSCVYTYIPSEKLACVSFTWEGVPMLYAAGAASLEPLTDETTVQELLEGTAVYVTRGADTDAARSDITAAWACTQGVSYVVSDDAGFTPELMKTVLSGILKAQNG